MGIRSLAKQIQSSFNKSSHCHELFVRLKSPKYFVLSMPLSFYFFQDESFQVLSYGYALLTIEIPDKLCTYHRENWKPFDHFWNASLRKASIMWTFLERTLNLQS